MFPLDCWYKLIQENLAMPNALPKNSVNLTPLPDTKREFSRCLFLKLAAGIGVTAALGDALFTSAP